LKKCVSIKRFENNHKKQLKINTLKLRLLKMVLNCRNVKFLK
jgi:hypothetical protein